MSNSVQAVLRPGETFRISIPLTFGTVKATMFILHFSSNRSFIEPCMRRTMRQTAKFASDNTGHKLIIVGHTDKVDTEAYNQSLSERRARSVFAYLTFGGARKAALDEWNQLRLSKLKNELPSIKDSWGTREYQHILQDLGFYPGQIDGDHGPLTSSAVRAFRCTSGLPPGETVDDPTWEALIIAYLSQDRLNVKEDRFLTNCPTEILKWLGCGEHDPVKNVPTAWRPNRRVELLFVPVDKLPCEVPQPDTFDLPVKGAVNKSWCLGPGNVNKRCCFVFPALPAKDAKPEKGQFVRQPGEPGTITVEGSIKREAQLKDGSTALNEDGTIKLEPAGGQRFFLIAPDGEIKASENPSNGEPQPALTDGKGNFKFADKPAGLYTLAVMEDVLVRRDTQEDKEVKGNSVCKVLLPNKTKFDVVILNAPALREIHLPVVAHLITALNPDTNKTRPCPPSRGVPVTQASTLGPDDIEKFFNGEGEEFQGVNFIWRQARIRFEVAEVIREVFVNPSRNQCQIDNAELGTFLQLCTYPNVVNVFFVMSLDDPDNSGDAGWAVSPERAAAQNLTSAGCIVGQLFQKQFGGSTFTEPQTEAQMVQVLAHELGHFLNVQHVEKPDSPANAGRLMRPSSFDGKNRLLTKDEVKLARAGRGAALECVPLKLKVTGAFQIGGNLSPEFIFVRPEGPGATPDVVVDAVIPPALIEPGVGEVKMTGGKDGASNLQKLVSTSLVATEQIVAIYTPTTGGDVIKTNVTIFVSVFFLTVEGKGVKRTGPGTFLAHTDAAEEITIVARISPQPFCVPINFVLWKKATPTVDPLRATVSMGKVAQTVVTATIGGQTRSVTISVLDQLAFTKNQAPFEKALATVQIEGILNKDRASFDISDLFDTQPESVFRLRADVPGVAGLTIPARLTTTPGEPRDIELTRTVGDTFVSPPLLLIPLAIPRSDIKLKTTQTAESLNFIQAQAEGKIQFELLGALSAAQKAQAKVRGRVVRLCTVTIKGSSPKPVSDLDVANRVWAQLGIEIRILNATTVDRPDLLHIINVPSGSQPNPSPDEIALFQLGRTCASDVVSYYCKTSTIGAFGRTTIVPNRTGFYQMDKATKYTFGHELGHVIGADHVKDTTKEKDNLMTDEGTQGLPDKPNEVNLTARQAGEVQFSAFVQFLE
jgi:outer membrane protein OmpA-like peptidoglycan-associated protein